MSALHYCTTLHCTVVYYVQVLQKSPITKDRQLTRSWEEVTEQCLKTMVLIFTVEKLNVCRHLNCRKVQFYSYANCTQLQLGGGCPPQAFTSKQ